MIVRGGNRNTPWDISPDGRGRVNAKSNPRIFFASRDDGQAFCLVSVLSSIAAGNYAALIKNNSQSNYIFIDSVHLGAANAALWKIWEVTGTQVGGTAIVPRQLNLSRGRSADATAYGDTAITSGLTTVGRPIDVMRGAANDHVSELYSDSLIMGPESTLAIEYDTGTTGAAEVSIRFHFEAIPE